MASVPEQESSSSQQLCAGESVTVRNGPVNYRTTGIERFLLMATIVLLPLQDHIPTVAGFSILFLIFAGLATYLIVNRPQVLDRIWLDPVFVAAYVFLCISALLEFSSPLSMYKEIVRFGQMIGGAILIASLCRDRAALTASLYGYIGAALWLAVVLMFTSYGTLHGASALNFHEASVVQDQAFKDLSLAGNINIMAFTCVQGGIVALVFALMGSPYRRKLFLVAAVICLAASCLTMSRGGIAMAALSCTVVIYACGLKQGKVFIPAGIICASILMLVPSATWSRLGIAAEQGKVEGRIFLYTAAAESLPKYVVAGVGAGNYYGKWGFQNGFGRGAAFSIDVHGVHNSFLQILINWGLTGLLSFILMVWLAYRCLPKQPGTDLLALSLLGIGISSLSYLAFMHNFYDKSFSLALGMLVASRSWIWPRDMLGRVKMPHVHLPSLSSLRA